MLLLLQTAAGPDDRVMLIILGVILLIALIFLGLRFFRALFEVITAPTASLKYHGQSDQFFYSLMIVFLGGLISVMIMMVTQSKIEAAYDNYSTKVSSDLGQANSNPVYQDTARAYAKQHLDDNFDIYFIQNKFLIPMVFLLGWFFIGTLSFIFPKMFQSGAAWVDMLGTLAYSSFFFSIGIGMAAPFIIDFIASKAGASPSGPDPLAIAGCVLMLYGLILYLMGVSSAAEISTGQMIGVVIFTAVILGGLGYWGFSTGKQNFDKFRSKVTSFNPAIGTNI